MNITNNKVSSLEILVSTMNRNSLDFLYTMFQHNDINKHRILIVNQTTPEVLLESHQNNIRVFNSFKYGVSKSRNLAIKNAHASVILLADDDVVFLPNFETIILNAYNEVDADLISFQTLTTNNKPYSNYPNKICDLKTFYKKVLSVEITFQLKKIKEKEVFFDSNFGLGSTFEDGENRVFFNDIFSKQIKTAFYPNYIVIHKPKSSSDDVVSNRFIFARSALKYKTHGILAYVYTLKHVASLLRKGLISPKEVPLKIKAGYHGISTFKKNKT